MTSYPNRGPRTLSEAHRKMLYEDSGISPDVAAERGVHTITHGRDLPEGFSRRQRRRGGGLLFIGHRPNGKTSYSYRPDAPDLKRPGHKYEQPCKHLGAPGNVLDVHPSIRHLKDDVSVPVIFCEGIKKADSIISAARREGVAVLVVAITGVWNWMADGEPIADLFDIPVDGRRVTICFDSDMLRNPSVQDAAHGFAEHLLGRGAEVFITYLHDQDDGSKTGADDFLAGGSTLAELRMLTRRYDPADFVRVRLSRSEKLQADIRKLWRAWHERDWMHFVGKPKVNRKTGKITERPNWQRGHTARDVKAALIGLASKAGKVDDRGIEIRVGLRRLAELSAKSAPSVGHALGHLEEDGQLEILPPEGKDKPRSYRLLVPRATLYSMERADADETTPESATGRCKGLRAPTAPRLRWSSPARKVERLRGVTPETRRVRQTRRFHKGVTVEESKNLFPNKPYIKRLGPHRCAILDALEVACGELHLENLCEVLHRKRPRDVRRRILPMLEKAGIIEVDGDVVRLAADWLARLEEERERTSEVSYADEQREKHREQRERYRDYLKSVKHLPSKATREALKRGHEQREAGLAAEARRAAEAKRTEEVKRAEAFVRDKLAALGRIRLGLLRDIGRDAGFDPWTTTAAVEALGCRVEELPEYGGRRFVFPPAERVA